MISLMKLVEGKYDYGCVMARIHEESAQKILDFNRKTIGEHIIYREGDDYGREESPHITLKYGLVNGYTEEQMKKILHHVTPFTIDVKGISIFENEKFDVVKFDVDGKELRALNELFSKLPNHDEYPEYHPHMTLAYVRKGMGKRYIKEVKKIAKIPVNCIVYSNRGEKSFFNLNETLPSKRWSAVVIDDQSRNLLLAEYKHEIPEGWEIIAHHMTIDFKGLSDEAGKRVQLKVTEVGKSDKAFAVKVEGYPSKNAIPHITIAIDRNNGGKPKDSNDIQNWIRVANGITLNGNVENL